MRAVRVCVCGHHNLFKEGSKPFSGACMVAATDMDISLL